MSDPAITKATTAATISNATSQPREMTTEPETTLALASMPHQSVLLKDDKSDAEEVPHEELKNRVVESLEAHRIASEATVKMLQRNVELEHRSLANSSSSDEGNASTRPELFCDFR